MNKKHSKLTLVLLIISFCFNMFFAGGYLVSRRIQKKLRTPKGRMELVARRLKLSPAQQESFLQLREQLQTQAEKIRQDYQTDIDAFWQEVAKDNPDSLKIKVLLDRAVQGRKEFMILSTEQIQDFLKILGPKQREGYVKFLKRNRLLRIK